MTETPKPCHPDEHNWATAMMLTRQSGNAHLTSFGTHRVCFDCGAHQLQKKDLTWIPLGNPRPKQPVVWM